MASQQEVSQQAVSSAHAEKDQALSLALAELATGQVDALDVIWRLCADELYGLALWRTGAREDAEDAVQEVFVRLVRTAARVAAAHKPRAYLLAMARRAAIDVGRRRRHTRLEAAEPLVAPADDPDTRLDAARVSQLLVRLSPKLREAVFLRHFAELSFAEAAKVMRVPMFTAASRYRLALRRLRQWMGVGQ